MKLIYIFLFVMPQLHAQSKISIFFESNKHKTQDKGLQELKEFIQNNFNYIDSITFIAYTDTVGSEEKNKKLAQKRLEFVESNIDNNLSYKAKRLVRGETKRYKFERNRRVDLIIYSSFKENITADSSIPDRNFCHKIDYNLLSFCSFKKVTIGGKNFMQIETEFFINDRRNLHYFISNPDDSVHRLLPVTWKNKMTGKDWWKKKRHLALIPLKSFEHSKIFKLENGPCNSCHSNSDNPKKDSILIHSVMINDNFQYKKSIFNKNGLKIRVPSQFVNPNIVYYFRNYQKVNWKKGKNDDYYTCKVKHGNSDFSDIKFYHFAENCQLPNTNRLIRPGNRINDMMCGGLRVSDEGLKLKLETGYHYKSKSHSAYLAFQAYEWRVKKNFEVQGFLGAIYNDKINYYLSQRFKYSLFHTDIFPNRYYTKWQNKYERIIFNQHLFVYFGSDFMNNVVKEKPAVLNYSYLELRYTNDYNYLFNSLFLRFGIGQTYIKKSHDIQAMFQFGILHDLYL